MCSYECYCAGVLLGYVVVCVIVLVLRSVLGECVVMSVTVQVCC